ncbi:175_t:CDS:1, partial [Dentiscutata heterogama]
NRQHEAISWLVSQQTEALEKGSFIIQNTSKKNDEIENISGYNTIPENKQEIDIIFGKQKFKIMYKLPESDKENNSNNNSPRPYSYYLHKPDPMPSIYVSLVDSGGDKVNVRTINRFITEVTTAYEDRLKACHKRTKYKHNEGRWYRVHTLADINGLESVVLDMDQEKRIKEEIDSFINGKVSYRNVGMTYKLGILMYGDPGTGKSSLVNAISSYTNRDLYYINLKEIKNDNEMSAVFTSVPSNQIIVLEDVDAQSSVLNKRSQNFNLFGDSFVSGSIDDEMDKGSLKLKDLLSTISLSNFLSCLDGQSLADGTIIIMTTNHKDHLDEACIRLGRMDVHLHLSYCTRYQIKKMYKNVCGKEEKIFPDEILNKIPEKVLAPCNVMVKMMSLRNELDKIPQEICELVKPM